MSERECCVCGKARQVVDNKVEGVQIYFGKEKRWIGFCSDCDTGKGFMSLVAKYNKKKRMDIVQEILDMCADNTKILEGHYSMVDRAMNSISEDLGKMSLQELRKEKVMLITRYDPIVGTKRGE